MTTPTSVAELIKRTEVDIVGVKTTMWRGLSSEKWQVMKNGSNKPLLQDSDDEAEACRIFWEHEHAE